MEINNYEQITELIYWVDGRGQRTDVTKSVISITAIIENRPKLEEIE